MSCLLSVDPGLATCGYAVLEHWLECEVTREPVVLLAAVGTIKTKPTEYGKRLNELYADIEALIAQYEPDAIAIEKLFSHFKNKSSMEGVSAARGCVFMLAAEYGIPVTEYTPSAVKAFVSGNGRADKRKVQESVSRILHVPIIQPDDACDAVAIGLTHLRWRGEVP